MERARPRSVAIDLLAVGAPAPPWRVGRLYSEYEIAAPGASATPLFEANAPGLIEFGSQKTRNAPGFMASEFVGFFCSGNSFLWRVDLVMRQRSACAAPPTVLFASLIFAGRFKPFGRTRHRKVVQ